MKTLIRSALAGGVLAATTLSASAVDPFEVFELCLDRSVDSVQGAYVEGPRERSRSQRERVFEYRLHMPQKIVKASKRKMLDTFYYCLEGNGFARSKLFFIEGSVIAFEAEGDGRLRARVDYFERLGIEQFGFEESTISLSLITN